MILSQKVCVGRIRTNVPTSGYNIQSLFRILPQHTVSLRCAKSLELPQNGFLRGNQACSAATGARMAGLHLYGGANPELPEGPWRTQGGTPQWHLHSQAAMAASLRCAQAQGLPGTTARGLGPAGHPGRETCPRHCAQALHCPGRGLPLGRGGGPHPGHGHHSQQASWTPCKRGCPSQ